MKQFNLQEYLKNPSLKIVTRDGKPVRILCIDAKGNFPIVGLIYYYDEEKEIPESYTENGSYYLGDKESRNDLFFETKQVDGWINIYKMPDTDGLETSIIFNTKEEADLYHRDNPNYVSTTKITWED